MVNVGIDFYKKLVYYSVIPNRGYDKGILACEDLPERDWWFYVLSCGNHYGARS